MQVERKVFETALRELKKVADTKSRTLPVLSHIHMNFLRDGRLKLVGTDLEATLVLYVPYEKDGNQSVPIKHEPKHPNLREQMYYLMVEETIDTIEWNAPKGERDEYDNYKWRGHYQEDYKKVPHPIALRVAIIGCQYDKFKPRHGRKDQGVFPLANIQGLLRAMPKPTRLAKQEGKKDNSTIPISIQGQKLHIGKYTIMGIDSAEFPTIPELLHSQYTHHIEGLTQKLEKVVWAISGDDLRYGLTGAYFDFQNGNLVTTDGHRLHMADIPTNGMKPFILPKKGVHFLVKNKDVTGRFAVNDPHSQFELGNGYLIIRNLSGEFPDYMSIIPKSVNNELTVNRKKLTESLIEASVLTYERFKGINFTLDGALTITMDNPDIGKFEDTLEVKWTGPQLETAFQPRYLIEALENIESEEVTMLISDKDSPALIRDGDFTGLVMPMRLKERE